MSRGNKSGIFNTLETTHSLLTAIFVIRNGERLQTFTAPKLISNSIKRIEKKISFLFIVVVVVFPIVR